MTTRRPSGGGISDLLRYPYIVGAVTFVFSLIPIALKSDAAVILFFLPILMSGGLAPTGRAIVVVVGLLVLLVTHIFAFGADLRTSLHFTEFAVPAVVIAASGAVAPIVYRLAMQLLEARAQAARDKPPKAPKAPKAPKPPKTQSPPPAVPQPVPQQAAPASPAPKQSGGSLFGRLKQAVPANMTRQEKAGAGSLVKDVSKAVKASSDIVALCKSVLDAVAKSIQFEKAIVSLIDASQGTFTDVYHAGIDVPGRKMGDASQLTGSFTETVANAKTPRLIQPATEQDMASVPASLMPSVTAGLFSFIAAPIVHEDTAIGILHLRSTTRSAYTEEHLALVARVAGLMAPRIVQFRVAADAALAQARAFVDPGAPPPAVPQALPPAAPAGTPAASTPQQDTRPRAAQPQAPDAAPGSEKASAGQVQVQEVLGQLVQAANSTKDIANVYDVLADLMKTLVPFDRIAISRTDLERSVLTTVFASLPDLPGSAPGTQSVFEDTLFQFIVRQRRGLVLGTDADDQAAARHPVQLQFVAMNLPSLVAVPLVHQDRVVGILELRSKHLKAYGQIELGLLHKMASIIAPGAYDSRIGVVRRKPAVVRRVVLSDKPVERAPQLAVPKAAPPEPSPQSADEPQEQIEQQKPEIGTPTDDAPRNIVKVSPSIEPALSEVKRPADDDPDVVPRVVQRQSMLDDDEVFEVLEEIKRTVTADTRGRDDDDEEEVTRQPVRVPLGSRDDEELDDLRREVRESKAEAEIARAAATARSMEDTFSAAAKHLADVISVDSLHLFTLDESKERLAADYLLGTDIDGWERGRYIPVEGSFFETTVRSQSHYLAAADSSVDLAEMHPPLTSAAAAGLASILVVPLVHQSQAVGVIALGSRLPIAYQQRHIDFLNRIAPVLSNAVVEANEADATKRQSEQEAALRRISAGLTSILKAEEVYQRLADGIAKLVRFDRLVVNEIDHEEKDLVRVFAAGVDIPKTILGGRQPIQGSTAAEVLSTRAPVLVSGLSDADLKRRFPAMAPAVEMGLKSLITAPIIVEDRVIATLHLFSKDARGYKQADAVLAGRVANLAAPAIANARTRAAILEAEKRAAEEAAAKAEDPMLEIGRVVWTVPDIQSMYEQVGEYVQELIPFDRFAVWTVDVERGALVNTFVAAMEDGQVTRVEPVAAQRSTARLALTRAAGNGNRDDADSAGRLEQLASGIADGLPGLILVPLFYENEGVGMLSFASHEEDTFTPEHEELAEAVGQLMAARVGLEQISIRRAFTAHHMRQQLEQMGVEVAERTRELDTVKSELEILKSTVDHDLRQPLDTIEDVIDAVLESLAQGKSKDSRTQLLRVRAASRVAAQQLNVLAQMSEVANRSMAVERIDLTGLARTVSKKVRDANPGQSVTVSVGKELSVEADRYLLEVLFGSLLTQAWNRASGASKPRIQIGASTSDGRLVFYMKDNGKAVGSAAAEAMFTENSGMANSLARRVVARHNGRIWAESESGKGNTVYFSLAS